MHINIRHPGPTRFLLRTLAHHSVAHHHLIVLLILCVFAVSNGFRYSGVSHQSLTRAQMVPTASQLPNGLSRRVVSTGKFSRSRFVQEKPLMATLDEVKEVIASQLGVDQEKVVPDANFINDLGADSLDSVELIMALEEKFGVTIPDEDATKLKTVKDALEYIEERRKEEAKTPTPAS